MKVQLSYPYKSKAGDQHDVGDTADLPVNEANRVIDSGYATKVDATDDLDDLTVAELRDRAEADGIDLAGATKKADIVSALRSEGN